MNYILKDKGIKFINELLNLKIRDFYSYNRIISELLKIKTNIPVFISSNMVLLPIKAYKSYDCVWINYPEIKEIIDNRTKVLIKFKNSEIKEFDISFKKLNRIIKNADIIITYFKKIECESVIN